jgi:hypothetical protein
MAYSERRRREPVKTTGEGVLHYLGYHGDVAYELTGVLKGLRAGGPPLRGAIHTSAEGAKGAFSAGRGHLQLEDGKQYAVTVVGHTEGSGTAYIELSA